MRPRCEIVYPEVAGRTMESSRTSFVPTNQRRIDPAPKAIAIQPTSINTPPIGVIAPSQRRPVTDRTYRLPEKIKEPSRKDQPATWIDCAAMARCTHQPHGQKGQCTVHVILRGGLKIRLKPLGGEASRLAADRYESILQPVRTEGAHRNGQKTPDRPEPQPEYGTHHDGLFIGE